MTYKIPKKNEFLTKLLVTKFYIPTDLNDVISELVDFDHILDDITRNEIISSGDQEMCQYHSGLGMWLRNNWGLWSGSRLAQYFNSIGIHHPDDMSGIILTSVWRKLHNVPLEVEGQVLIYQQYWEDQQ